MAHARDKGVQVKGEEEGEGGEKGVVEGAKCGSRGCKAGREGREC